MRAEVHGPTLDVTVPCSVTRPPAAPITFLPQAQALLRHRQDAGAEQRQQALLNSWAKPRGLEWSPTHTHRPKSPTKAAGRAHVSRNAYRRGCVGAIRGIPNTAVFAVCVEEGNDNWPGSRPYTLLQATWQAAETLLSTPSSCW